MAIPSGYTRVEYIQSSGTQYIDSGVSPASYLNTLKIVADAQYTTIPSGSTATAFIFGTGYYNSTTANRRTIFAGKRGSTSTSNFAFLSGAALGTAVEFSGATLDTNRHTFTIDQVSGLYGFDNATQSFSTTVNSNLTETLKIFCGHASGTSGNPLSGYASARLYSFQIYDNDTLIRDFAPVKRDSDSAYGLYDQVNDVFYANSGTGSFTGGDIYYTISTPVIGEGTVTGGGEFVANTTRILRAVAGYHYEFDKWADGETSNPRTITVTGDATYTAVFKKTKITIGEDYFLYGKSRESLRNDFTFFSPVMNADINEDLMQKAISTIICYEQVTLNDGDFICLRDSRGNVVYYGIIQAVEGNKITTNQAQAIVGRTIMLTTDTSNEKSFYSDYTPTERAERILNAIRNGWFSTAYNTGFMTPRDGRDLFNTDTSSVIVLTYGSLDYDAPWQEEAEEINGEDFLYSAYSDDELIFYFNEDPLNRNTYYLNIFTPSQMYDGQNGVPSFRTIDLSDFNEFVQNIDMVIETTENNVLSVYDSTGETNRANMTIVYRTPLDKYFPYDAGAQGNLPDTTTLLQRIAPIKRVYVKSDDDLSTLWRNFISTNQYNHKVNFTFDLDNNFYDFGDLHLGEYINFYIGDRLYNSVLTAWSFHIEQGQTLKQINMVCGKVRNNLTSKLNLGKVK